MGPAWVIPDASPCTSCRRQCRSVTSPSAEVSFKGKEHDDEEAVQHKNRARSLPGNAAVSLGSVWCGRSMCVCLSTSRRSCSISCVLPRGRGRGRKYGYVLHAPCMRRCAHKSIHGRARPKQSDGQFDGFGTTPPPSRRLYLCTISEVGLSWASPAPSETRNVFIASPAWPPQQSGWVVALGSSD